MRACFISAVFCAVIATSLCNEATCSSDDDDRCEFLQSGVGVLSEHRNDEHEHRKEGQKHKEHDVGVLLSEKKKDFHVNEFKSEQKKEGQKHEEHHKEHHKEHHEKHHKEHHKELKEHGKEKKAVQHDEGSFAEHHEELKEHGKEKKAVQRDELLDALGGAAWPDFLKDLSKMITGASTVKEDAEKLKDKVVAFGEKVKKITMDLLDKAKTAEQVDAIVKEVDAASAKINTALKSVIDAVAKVGKDFASGIGSLIPSEKFKSFIESTLNAVKTEGDRLQEKLNMTLSKVDASKVCIEAETKLNEVKMQIGIFLNSTVGMTAEGMKKEVDALYALLPEDAKKEVAKFIDKATEAGETLRDTVSTAGKEIYDSIGLAFKHQCPNFASFVPSSAVHVTVGVVTAIAVSAAALTI